MQPCRVAMSLRVMPENVMFDDVSSLSDPTPESFSKVK